MDVTTHMPDLVKRPLDVELLLNGAAICALSLYRQGWLELHIPVPEALRRPNEAGVFELEITASHTWQPRPNGDETRDDRELSIAVCNIEVKK